MRLAVVSHTLIARASDQRWVTVNRVGEVVNALAERGWQTTLISRERRGDVDFATYPLAGGVRVVSVPASDLTGQLRRVRAVAHSLHDADATLAFMPSLFAALMIVASARPTVMYAGGSWAGDTRFGFWRSWLESMAARRASAVVVSGHALAARFRHAGCAVHVGVPLVPDEVNRRLRLGDVQYPEPSPLRILFVGSISRLKGVPELLAALATRPDVECRIFGPVVEQDLAAEVERATRELPNVTYGGYIEWPGLADAFRWANTLVLPSHTEGFPRVVFEAAAFGLALVVTPVGGIPMRLRHEHDALFVSPGDVESLGAALDRLAAEPAFLTQLAQTATRNLGAVFVDPDGATQFDRLLRAHVQSL